MARWVERDGKIFDISLIPSFQAQREVDIFIKKVRKARSLELRNTQVAMDYSDSSDNPEWTTQQAGANLTTEIYTGSLGAGLAVTTTFKGTVRTSSMQLTDIRGHTVTTLDLDSNSVRAWSVYDSFGNPQTSQTNTNLINYSSYG
jgi:hypothetical protein